MGGRQDKKARRELRKMLSDKLAEEKVEIMPQVKRLKEATLNLKPCFELFGITFFKTKDVIAFYDTLKEWIGERPKRIAKKRFWQAFNKLTTEPPKVDKPAGENVARETLEGAAPAPAVQK